jgi:hypothetical protein
MTVAKQTVMASMTMLKQNAAMYLGAAESSGLLAICDAILDSTFR